MKKTASAADCVSVTARLWHSELTRASRTNFLLLHYPMRCTSCGQCQLSCLHDAIYLTKPVRACH